MEGPIQIPYGGGEGLNFKAPLTDYKLDWDKKGTAKIKFTARSQHHGPSPCRKCPVHIYFIFPGCDEFFNRLFL